MNEASRRGFLATAGVGAATVGIAALAPGAQAATSSSAKVTTPAHASGSLVAHVADVKGDTVTLLVDEREVVVRDAELVARLARAAH
jgi:hypothetical protein